MDPQDFPWPALGLGVVLGLFLQAISSLFVARCVFGGRGTLHGKPSNTIHAPFEEEMVRTSMGRTRVLIRRHPDSNSNWVVLIHGFAGALDVFSDPKRSNYCQALHHDLQLNVLAIDLYGHGGSDAPDTQFNAELYASQLAELVLKLHLPPSFYVVAHSMGCAVAVTFASCHPGRVAKLVLLSPSVAHKSFPLHLRLALRVPVFGPVLSACIIPTFGEGTNLGNRGFVRSCYRLLQTRLGTKGSWNAGEWKTLKLCAAMEREQEVLVLWGDADEVESFRRAHDQLLHVLPRALLCACPGGDHMSFADGTQEEKLFYLDRIRAFLAPPPDDDDDNTSLLARLGVVRFDKFYYNLLLGEGEDGMEDTLL